MPSPSEPNLRIVYRQPNAVAMDSAPLSRRGQDNAAVVNGPLRGMLELFRDQYDAKTNPNGIVVVGVADNSLMRKEVLKWVNSDRLKLQPPELTYGDRISSSTRLVKALCTLFNDVPMGLDADKPKLIKPVVPDHIVVGSGATGILDALFLVLCNPGDGVLLSVPYYNGFDHDLSARAEAKIIEVHTPLPEVFDPSKPKAPEQPSPAFTPDTVKAYEEALARARKDGVKVTSILVCNPHNPTGLVYPRETLVALARLAAKESLHLVVDEIYARSVFSSPDIPDDAATRFHSILTIDVEKEAGLPLANVHVVTSISKDFGANGFRLGVYVNQGSQDAISAMSSLGILSQSSSPAGALWYLWLEDRGEGGFLPYFFAENHRRMTIAYRYITEWAQRHGIRYVAANSGHFVMLDLRPYLNAKDGDIDAARKAEAALTQRFIEARVFVAPSAQYHHPQPGWFRFTFSLELGAVRVALQRMEKVMGLESKTVAAPDVERGALPLPPSLQAIIAQELGNERPTPTLVGELPDAQVLAAISQRRAEPLVQLVTGTPARKTHRVLSSITHNILLSALAQPHHIDELVAFFLSLVPPMQQANSALVGLEREADFLKSGMRPAEGAGQSLLEHFVAEIHTACLQLSTNASTPHPEEAQLDANYWRRAAVYGLVLGRLFAAEEARARSWPAVEDLLVKGLFSPAKKCGGPPSPGLLVLLPTCLLVSADAIKAHLAQQPGRGKDFLWYDNVRQSDEIWEWRDVVAALHEGIDKQIVAAIGVTLPREAAQEWDRARECVEGEQESRTVANVLDDVRWALS